MVAVSFKFFSLSYLNFGHTNVEDVVSLVRAHGAVNWALFQRNAKARKSIAKVIRPSVGHIVPAGGYRAATARTTATRYSAVAGISAADASSSKDPRDPHYEAANRLSVPMAAGQLLQVQRQQEPPRGDSPTHKVRLCGPLLKQSPGWFQRWQLRHFEIADGKLRWWLALEQKQHGEPPKNELDLLAVKVVQVDSSKFNLQAPNGGRLLLLDADVTGCTQTAAVHQKQDWIKALEQEVILSRSRRDDVNSAARGRTPILAGAQTGRWCFA